MQGTTKESRYVSRPACLKSRSTSWEGGQWPSAPRAPGSSSKGIATERAAVQENREPQRSRQACSARFRIRGHSERALALARELRNDLVSKDQGPQTSKDQHHQASAPRTTYKLRITPLLHPPSGLQRCTVIMESPCCAVRVECAHDGCVDGELGSPEERQPSATPPTCACLLHWARQRPGREP